MARTFGIHEDPWMFGPNADLQLDSVPRMEEQMLTATFPVSYGMPGSYLS